MEGKWTEDFTEKANLLDLQFASISTMDDPEGTLPEPTEYRDDIPAIS